MQHIATHANTPKYLPAPILIHKHVIWISFHFWRPVPSEKPPHDSSFVEEHAPVQMVSAAAWARRWADFSHKIRFGFDPHVCWLNNYISSGNLT